MEESRQEIEKAFKGIEYQFIKRFNKKPTIEAILLMIGFQECPQTKTNLSKEEKLDLVNLGTLTVLSQLGYFIKTSAPGEWPTFEPIPSPKEDDYDFLIKKAILHYFKEFPLTVGEE